jgi:copper chaperone NosL
MNPVLRKYVPVILIMATLSACGKSSDSSATLEAIEINSGTACSLDGMLLADYPGPKAQIQYAGQAEPDFFCDTVEMFNLILGPEQVKVVRGAFVQDMGRADWDQPRGQWIDAKQAFYVHGSKRHGSMGPTIASFAQEKDAARFAAEFGGKVYRFSDITPDLVVMDGGSIHDSNM